MLFRSQAVAAVSDAVVIGTALVQLLETRTRDNVAAAAGEFIAGIRAALDGAAGAVAGTTTLETTP